MRVHIHYVVIGCLVLGTLISSGISYHHQVTARSHRPQAVRRETARVRSAIDDLSDSNGGNAKLAYLRHGHKLVFSVANYDVRGKFKGDNLKRQLDYFKHHTGIRDTTAHVSMTREAIHHHQIQVAEQKRQQEENHRRVRAMIKAQKRAKKKTEQKKAEAKRKAKEKAEQQARIRKQKRKKAQQDEAKQKARKKHRSRR